LTSLQIALIVFVFICVCLFVSHVFEASNDFTIDSVDVYMNCHTINKVCDSDDECKRGTKNIVNLQNVRRHWVKQVCPSVPVPLTDHFNHHLQNN
jgi:hypothetical protein